MKEMITVFRGLMLGGLIVLTSATKGAGQTEPFKVQTGTTAIGSQVAAGGTNPKKKKKKKKKEEEKEPCGCPDKAVCLDYDANGLLLNNPPTQVEKNATIYIRVMKGAGESEQGIKRLALRLTNTYLLLKGGSGSPAEKLLQNAGFVALSADQMQAIACQYAKTILALSSADKLKHWVTEPIYNELGDAAKCKEGSLINVKKEDYAKYQVNWSYPENRTCATPDTLKTPESSCDCWVQYRPKAEKVEAGTLHFELRRGNALYDALAQQAGTGGLPPMPSGIIFEQPRAVAKTYKPLAERTDKLLKVIKSETFSKRARRDSLKTLIEVTEIIRTADEAVVAQRQALKKQNFRTPALAQYLLRTFWIKNGKSLTATPAAGLTSDSLLYQGLVKVSAPKGKHDTNLIKMRNHDAAQNYKLTNAKEAGGINEDQDMALLVHNVTSKNKPSIGAVTFKAIAKDTELASEFLGGSGSPLQNSFSGLTKKEAVAIGEAQAVAEKFLGNYVALAAALAPFAQWKDPVNEPARLDSTANYRTEELAYQHPTPDKAPAVITYELKDGTSPITGVAGYEYRLAKLYRFRFKAGLMYSSLLRSKYTIDAATNVARRTDTREGQVAALGLQYFPSRIDIKNPAFWPKGNGFFYLGFTLTDKLAKNWLVGGGVELYSGIALLGGLHFSQTQQLQATNGVLSATEDLWRSGYFIQLALGLEAFNKLFNAADIKKPF
jgi:hypothetical protein